MTETQLRRAQARMRREHGRPKLPGTAAASDLVHVCMDAEKRASTRTHAPTSGRESDSTRAHADAPQFPAPPPAPRPLRAKRRGGRERIKHLSEEQIAALMGAIRGAGSVRDLAMFEVTYYHGLRAAEVGMLDLDDYHEQRERIHIHRLKGSISGEYPLLRVESRALRAWIRERGRAPGPLFPSRRRRGISQQMLHVLMQRYCAAAGIPRELAHPHALRHSCGTHLAAQGRDVLEIQDWLGHANIQNTMIYIKFSNRRRDKMARELEEW